jgi:AcrR family transcriptional regulator
VRVAILDALFRVVEREGYAGLTMDGLAAEAGVGKQTIYRWWRSRAEVALEALADRAHEMIGDVDRGSLARDLVAFFGATFEAGRRKGTLEVLRGLFAEAQLDPAFRETFFETFLAKRREALRVILRRACQRGEASPAKVDTCIDLGFGFLWYRVLFANAPLDERAARQLATALEAAAR